MVTDVPTLNLQTEVRGPAVLRVDNGVSRTLEMGQNLAQHNMGVAFKAWENQIEYASRIQGVKDASKVDYDPKNIPTENTIAAASYREGAAAIYGVRLESQTRTSLSMIGEQAGSTAQSNTMMDSYINATAERLPEQMREPYLKTALNDKARILEQKYAQETVLRKQSVKDQTDLDRLTLLRDVQTGQRPIGEALQSLQASYAAKVANGVDSPAGAYRDYLKDVDDFTVAASVPYYAEGDIVQKMTELANEESIPVELKNQISEKAFALARSRRQETEAAQTQSDRTRDRDFNTRVNSMILEYRQNNPSAPAAIDAATKSYTDKGWNPTLARQQAIDDASTAAVQQKNQLRQLLRENVDRLSPSASQALLDLGESEANRPLTYDDPSVIYKLNQLERDNGSVPNEILNRYLGNGLSYESEARYRTRADEKYQQVFGSTGWKEAMRQVDIKFPEPTDSVSLGGGIKISSPKWGNNDADAVKQEQRNAIIGRLTDIASANPSLVSDPARYKDWQDVVQQTFSTYGQAGTEKYVMDVRQKAESVLGQWGGFDGFKSAYEKGRVTEQQFRELYTQNGGILREYEALRKEGKIR